MLKTNKPGILKDHLISVYDPTSWTL